MEKQKLEAVGENFTINGILDLRRKTRLAIDSIAKAIEPGMAEEDGLAVAKKVMRQMGLPRGWHIPWVRFGRNTVREYGNPSEPGVILQENDIFFIDIGPIEGKLEGDGGATFVVGNDPEMRRASEDVYKLWQQVTKTWEIEGWTGRRLYEYAAMRALDMGWELNLKRMSGHRIGDFPHPHRYDGLLSEVDICPSPYVWILEMHIRHRERCFGAFYEDLMLPKAISMTPM